MITKAEVKKLKKGFHPFEGQNRKSRRAHKSNYGLNNMSKGWVMQIIGRSRFLTFLQQIPLKNGRIKTITQTKQLS